jgi:hypothetical protein
VRCPSSSNCQDLSATLKAESGKSSARYLPWKSEALQALDRCCVLADEINRELHTKKVRQLVNTPSLLAEFQVAIERAASVLGRIA